jgi:hypothetical protein
MIRVQNRAFGVLQDFLRKLLRIRTVIIGRWHLAVPSSSVRLEQCVPRSSARRTVSIGVVQPYQVHRFWDQVGHNTNRYDRR